MACGLRARSLRANQRIPSPLIDAETVREIESYYAKKRLRDQARAAKIQGSGRTALIRQSLADPARSCA